MELSEKKKTGKDIVFVLIGNIISIFSGILSGFVIPKILGVTEYGYYKTFTLYAGYIGLFHFGFCDGIQLIYAGKKQEELNQKLFLTFTHFLMVLEAIISFAICVIALCFLDNRLKFIFCCVALNLFLQNIMVYYQYILQCTQQFKEYSLKNIVNSVLNSLGIVSLWLFYKFGNVESISFKVYVAILLSIYASMVVWFLIRFRNITFGKGSPFKEAWPYIKKCLSLGFPLLVANLCSGLILSFDSQFVNIYFDTDIYAVYAFAYSILSMVTTMISAVTIVIYPRLKKTEKDKLTNIYPQLVSLLVVFISGCLIMFYPLVPVVNLILSQYSGSLIIFRIILPGLMLSSIVGVIIQNYYKALGKPGLFFIFSAITLAISIGLNFAAYYIFKTTEAISWASIITLIIYYFLTLIPLIVKMKVKWIKNTIYVGLMIATFYLCMLIDELWISFLVYFLVYIVCTLVLQWNTVKKVIINMKMKVSKK